MALRGDPKVAQREKKRENEVLVCICFETRKLVVMLIMNSGICLWEWVGVSVGNKGRYKHKVDKHKTEIKSGRWWTGMCHLGWWWGLDKDQFRVRMEGDDATDRWDTSPWG